MAEQKNAQNVDVNQLLKVRREKLQDLQERGKDPFQITKYDMTHHSMEIKDNFDELEGKTVSIAGRMMFKRVMGKASFCNIQDLQGSIQSYVARDNIGEESYADFKKYDVGDILGIKGEVFKTKTGEISIHATEVTLLSKSEEEIIRYLTRKEFNEKLMTEKRVKANEKQKKSVRTVMKELFNVTSASDDDDAIMRSFLGYASNLKNDLEKLDIYYATQSAYPGKNIILTGKKLMTDTMQMKYSAEFFAFVDQKKDDFLDFAEDYEPVKKFFAGEQKTLFDKALKLMKTYDDSKTFIVNGDIELVVKNVNDVLKKPSPYFEIFKLPELLDKFISLYGSLLKETQKPIDIAISDARQRVFEDLKDKKCHDKLADKYIRLFQEISDKANHCANIADLQNIKLEADALKVRCLNEISDEEAKLIACEQSAEQFDNCKSETMAPAVKVKKKKTLSIKSINAASTWQIENETDVKKYIAELEKELMNTLEEDTIINIEF